MAKLEGKTNETPLLVKIILGLAVIALLYFLANTFIYKKIDEEITALAAEQAQLDKKVQEGHGFRKTEAEHMQQIAYLADQLSAQSRCLPDGSEIEQLAREFYQDAQGKYQMFDASFNISNMTTNEKKLQEIPIEFRCSATYESLGELFQAISRYSRILTIETLDLRRLNEKARRSMPGWKKNAPPPSLRASFVAKTYSMVKDPTEDQQIQEVIAKARQQVGPGVKPVSPVPVVPPPPAATPAPVGSAEPGKPGAQPAPAAGTQPQVTDFGSPRYAGTGRPDPFVDPIEFMQETILRAKEKENAERIEKIAVIPPLNVRWQTFKGVRSFMLSEVTFNGVLENRDGSKTAILMGPDRHAHNVKKGDILYNAMISNIIRLGNVYQIILEEYELKPNSKLIDRIEGKKQAPIPISQAVQQARGTAEWNSVGVKSKIVVPSAKTGK